MKLSGWWEKNSINPSEKYEFVTGKDYISLSFNGKLKKNVPNHQPAPAMTSSSGAQANGPGLLGDLGRAIRKSTFI